MQETKDNAKDVTFHAALGTVEALGGDSEANLLGVENAYSVNFANLLTK